MISSITPGSQPVHQFISFVEGSASVAPNPSSFPLQVLGVDHNLNNINGGDPNEGFSPWVTDILVYPSSEYWESLLNSDRVRPYIDFSISEYNTLRMPSATHNYDLYVDDAKIYENCTIDGDLTVAGSIIIQDLSCTSVTTGNIQGVANTKVPVEELSVDTTIDASKTGYIFQCKPTGSSIVISLPNGQAGLIFTFMNCLSGKTVKFVNINAQGDTLGAQYASATVYWGGDAWYGFGSFL